MRRADREVLGADRLEAIMARCQVCRLAVNDGAYPYIVPMNFGYARQGDGFALYFHCAHEGRKLDLLRADPRAAFEMDCGLRVIGHESAPRFTMAYASLVGRGDISIVEGEEKRRGLLAILRQYAPGRAFEVDEAAVNSVTVLRLDVSEMTGKANRQEGS